MAIPGAFLQPMSIGVTGSFYPERFDDPRLRLSGVSLGRQLGTILGGGIMPMVSASLLAASGGALTWVLAYFVLICALAVGAVISSRETARVPLAEQNIGPMDRRNPATRR
jgi:MFS family permease